VSFAAITLCIASQRVTVVVVVVVVVGVVVVVYFVIDSVTKLLDTLKYNITVCGLGQLEHWKRVFESCLRHECPQFSVL